MTAAQGDRLALLSDELRRLARECSGTVGIHVRWLDGDRSFGLRSERSFPTASLIKVFVSACLLARASRGRIDLKERIELGPPPRTRGSGVLSELDAGLQPTLADLALLMHAVSDNHATNLLIERLGMDVIQGFIDELGLKHTRLGGPVDFDRLREDQRALGASTPAEMTRFFQLMARGDALAEPFRDRWLRLLRVQKYIEPMRRHLPLDPYAEEFGDPTPVRVASKTGSLRGVRCEAGLVETREQSWALCVMTEGLADPAPTSDNEGTRLIAAVSRAVYEAAEESR